MTEAGVSHLALSLFRPFPYHAVLVPEFQAFMCSIPCFSFFGHFYSYLVRIIICIMSIEYWHQSRESNLGAGAWVLAH